MTKIKTLKPRLKTINQSVIPDSSSRNSTKLGYNYKWQKARARFLRHHPLCIFCERDGRVTPATVVDHIKPHKGDEQLFWDTENWQPLCATCHSSDKQRLEKRY